MDVKETGAAEVVVKIPQAQVSIIRTTRPQELSQKKVKAEEASVKTPQAEGKVYIIR